ncbi:DNA helicase, UvrD type [Candidatus Mycoplasma haematolamae str. Purdue]|uniref:DNA 3'-5' helicase n=1 Tax=Mycoplasma haematolamae (strain Purdue) TaxID=1212765 RepID=I7BIW5_MYCHA|nr:ATP-dependent helicase [Candidatus Mycoplasma haematolamae]AFO51768.1 DNA helicase, UvrD type [Candidatus Mycoplasma haematolamae str. Purdue]
MLRRLFFSGLFLRKRKKSSCDWTPSPEQKEIISYRGNTHVGVLAGPGSGKTFVIMKRIEHYLKEEGILPKQLLISTFTNRAIAEIDHRIKKMVGDSSIEFEYSGTLHSICKKLLEEELTKELKEVSAREVQKVPLYMLSTKQKKDLIKSEVSYWLRQAVKGKKVKEEVTNQIIELIERELEDGLVRRKVDNYLAGEGEKRFNLSEDSYDCWYQESLWEDMQNLLRKHELLLCSNEIKDIPRLVLETYQTHLKDQDYFDFADLLIFTHKILDTFPFKKAELSARFKKILVDEFQDVNELQLLILLQLSHNNKNLFCVGDPNQSIYGFQGACPNIFKKFKDEIDETIKFFQLSRNYRSTGKIVRASKSLIDQNSRELEYLRLEEINTKNPEGEALEVLTGSATGATAVPVALLRKIDDYCASKSIARFEVAVLARTKYELANLIAESWNRGKKFIFFQLAEDMGKSDAHCFFICILSTLFKRSSFSYSFIAFYFCSQRKLPEYLTKSVVDCFAEEPSKNLRELIRESEEKDEDPAYLKSLRELDEMLEQLEGYKLSPDFDQAFFETMTFSDPKAVEGFLRNILKLKICRLLFSSRTEMIESIIYVYQRFRGIAGINTSIRFKDFLELLWAHSHLLKVGKSPDEYVNFSTIHGVKGCEFNCVFVLNLFEGRLPFFKAKQPKDIEEERRIFYVAITRAKEKVGLVLDMSYFADSKKKKQPWTVNGAADSRFLAELVSKGYEGDLSLGNLN